MPDHLSDSEVLEQTAEWLSRLADTIERITERMADRIATISAEQERQADEIRALSNRIEAVTRVNTAGPCPICGKPMRPVGDAGGGLCPDHGYRHPNDLKPRLQTP